MCVCVLKKETDRQRQTDRRTDRERDRQTEKETETESCFAPRALGVALHGLEQQAPLAAHAMEHLVSIVCLSLCVRERACVCV